MGTIQTRQAVALTTALVLTTRFAKESMMATHEPTVLLPLPQVKIVTKGRVPRTHLFIDGIEHKHCTSCGQDKPLTEYAKDKQRGDGYFLYCKDCKNEKKHLWDEAHHEEQQAYFRDYHLAHQEERCAASRANYYNNREARAAYSKAYALLHPEKLEWTRQWCKANPERVRQIKRINKQRRRAKLATLPFQWTAADEAFALQYWHYACAVCGTERGLQLDIALDHWIPVASPLCPGTVVGNMIPLCHTSKGTAMIAIACNQQKGKKDPHTWLVERLGKVKARAKLKAIEAFFLQATQFEANAAERTR